MTDIVCRKHKDPPMLGDYTWDDDEYSQCPRCKANDVPRCICMFWKENTVGGFFRDGRWWCSEACYERANDPQWITKAERGNQCYEH